MAEWGFLGGFFDNLQAHSPMLGRFWLLLMLVFRMLILGTVATDLFEDEQEEFICNTLQPGCKQVCYDMAFPISQYRFWVFQIVLIATPSLVFLMFATHHHNKKEKRSKSFRSSVQDDKEDLRFRGLYVINVSFRIVAEIGFIIIQYWLYGFEVKPQYPCSRSPCAYTVDCFTSRPTEKTIFLCFYFAIAVISAISSFVELIYISLKWFCPKKETLTPDDSSTSLNLHNFTHKDSEEQPGKKMAPKRASSRDSRRGSLLRSSTSRKSSRSGKFVSNGILEV